jgi:hypothetical protein
MSNFSRWQAGTATFLALGLTSGTLAPLVSPAPTFAYIYFSDIPDGYWAIDFISELIKMDIIEGFDSTEFSDPTFQPDGPVTRAQFAVMLQKANDEYWERPNIKPSVSFIDVGPIHRNRASYAIHSVTRTGFMRSYPDGKFRPEQPITREQVFVSLADGLGYRSTQDPSSVLSIYNDASAISGYAREAISGATVKQLVVNYPNVAILRPTSNATRAEVAAAIAQALVADGHIQEFKSPYIVTPTPKVTSP